jgi:hypothetical protein
VLILNAIAEFSPFFRRMRFLPGGIAILSMELALARWHACAFAEKEGSFDIPA